MNRYEISNDNYDVCVGWDVRMNTLFGHVFKKPGSSEGDDEDDDHLVRLVGGSHDEIKTIEELQELLARFVTIPENIVSLLRLDIIEATPRTELQELVRKTARGQS